MILTSCKPNQDDGISDIYVVSTNYVLQDTPEVESAVKDDDHSAAVKSDAEQQESIKSFVPNVDNQLTTVNIISDSTINDNIFNANDQPEDDDEIIVVCSPPRATNDSPPCSPPTLTNDDAQMSDHDAQISLKSDVAEQREADEAAAETESAAAAETEPVYEIDVVNDNPPNDHDQVQKLNDFDSAKAVNRYILQTNNTSSSSNIHNSSSSSNHINNENINDATAPATLNEDINDDANSTNAGTADNISHDASGIAQADKHTASATNNNNYQQQSNATAAATGASVESVEYATLAATDLCGGTLTVQGVDSEQSENFVVTSGYIQECGY